MHFDQQMPALKLSAKPGYHCEGLRRRSKVRARIMRARTLERPKQLKRRA